MYKKLFLTHKIYTPDYALVELDEYKAIFSKKFTQGKEEFDIFAHLIFSHLTIIPDLLLTEEIKQRALLLCRDIDVKDTPYVALALHLDKMLITRDKPLHDHLKNKGFEKVMLFHEFIQQHLKLI